MNAAQDTGITERGAGTVVITDCDHDTVEPAGDLVAEDDAGPGPGVLAGADVQVGAAQTAVGDIHQHLAVAGLGPGALLDGDVGAAGPDQRPHRPAHGSSLVRGGAVA